MSDMACRIQTFPALIVAGILLSVLSIINILYLIRKDINND